MKTVFVSPHATTLGETAKGEIFRFSRDIEGIFICTGKQMNEPHAGLIRAVRLDGHNAGWNRAFEPSEQVVIADAEIVIRG